MKFLKFNSKNFFLSFGLGFIIFLSLSWLILQSTAPKIPLLGFHGIIDAETPASQAVPAEMEYPKQELESFLEYLVSHNYWFLTTQELYDYFLTSSKKIPTEHLNQKPIMISFDDGYKTVYTNLVPILEKLEQKYGQKVKVVLFVNPGTLATPKSIASTHLGCQELREGFKKGFYDIQSHGLNHKKLTELNPQDLIVELLQAQTQLRSCTNGLDPEQKVASHLAYPYGAYNKQVEAYSSRYYLSSYLYNSRILKHCWLKNYYEIPRLTVNRRKPASLLIKMAQRSHQIKKKKNAKDC
jgi:peptidoglycan/xylan/chitin deacetylase (PgdA/CDA1 family)